MEIKAKAKYIRISPRKIRLVADLVRGLKIDAVFTQLHHSNKWAAKPVEKAVNSALANALNNFELDRDNLFLKSIKIDEGPTLHRWKPRARGRATPIRKRTSHIEIILGELVDSGRAKAKKGKIEAPIKLGVKPKKDEGVKIKDKDSSTREPEDKREDEKGKKIIDPRGEGKGKHVKIEGRSSKGFAGKFFRRKSG